MNLIIKSSIVMMLLFSNSTIKPPINNQNIVVSNDETTIDDSIVEVVSEDDILTDNSNVIIDNLIEIENSEGTLELEDGSEIKIVYMLPKASITETNEERAVRSIASTQSEESNFRLNASALSATSSSNPTSGHKVVWDYDPGYGYGTAIITSTIGGKTMYFYCIEPYLSEPTGQSYTTSPYSNSGVKAILNYGFPSDQLDLKSKYGKSDTQAYVGTFIAINAHIGNYSRKTIENAGDGYVNELLKEADKGYSKIDISITKNNLVSVYNQSKKRIESSEFISIGINRNTTRTFTLSGLPSGVYAIDENGNRVSTLKYNQKFKLATENLKYSGKISFSVNYNFLDMAAYKMETGSSGVQNLTGTLQDYDPPKNFTFNQTFTPALGSFELTKFDENGQAVKDVTFRIRDKDYKTDADGKIKIADLDLGEITYQEITVPSPIIIDKAVKKSTITAGTNTSVIVTNQIGKGIIEVTKQAEDGKNVANVGFEIKDSLGKVVSTLKTGTDGKARSVELPLGSYTVTETSVPKEYILNKTPQTVTLNYKDSTTPVVTSSATFTNNYQPIGSVSVEQIRIDTKKADVGLDVEAWFSKDLLYDYSLNDFRNAEVRVDVISINRKDAVATKTYTIETFPDYDSFHVDASILEKNTSDTYFIQLSVQEEDKVTLTTKRYIDTEGYTASEEIIKQDSKDGHDLTHEAIIRTQRVFGENMQTWSERLELDVPKLQRIRAGRGYAYDTQATYTNELDQDFGLDLTLFADNQIVDGTFYDQNDTETRIPLTQAEDKLYKVPRVYALKDITGEVISEDNFKLLSADKQEGYRDGGHQVLTPLWNTDLGTYPLRLETNAVGVNEVKVILSDQLELFAYMYGHFDADGVSKTIELDETNVSPISIYDGNGNGIPDIWDDGSMPDNFGVTLADGSKVLTLKEKEFFSVLGSTTLSYDLNGGQGSFPAKEVTEGETVKLPDKVPSRNGYLFDGWLSSSDGKIYKQNESITVAQDTKLIAQWKQQVFTVAFNLNGGSGTITSQSVAYGAKAAQPTNPIRTGYAFTGWSPDITQGITKDTTFTAQWKINQYNVIYDANGGTGAPGNSTVNHGTSISIGKAPTRAGYTFGGWKNLASGNTFNPGQSGFIVNANVTFTAQWTQNKYNVSFNLNGGTGTIASQSVAHGSKATVPTNPTRGAYTFTGWSPDINTAITSNTTFTAQWRVYSHTVAFNLNGGSGSFPSRTKTAFVQLLLPSNAPTRAGYTFSGWKDSKTGQVWSTGANYTPDYNGGTVTLTAQWKAVGETSTAKSIRQTIGNYTVVTYYTPVYQGTILKRIDYEVVAYKNAGSGYWSNNKVSTWSVTIANQTRSGTFSYDFRGKSEIRLTGGTISVNSTSFTNSASFRVYIESLGTFSGNGNLNK